MNSSYQKNDALLAKKISDSVYKRAIRQNKFGFFIEAFVGLFYFIIGLGAFISRVFLRRKLGERTFGIFTIAYSYLCIRLFYLWNGIQVASCADTVNLPATNLITCNDVFGQIIYLVTIPILVIIAPFSEGVDFPLTLNDGIEGSFNVFNLNSPGTSAAIFSSIFFFFAIIVFAEILYRNLFKFRWYSYHRGKSRLFRPLIGKKIAFLEIRDYHVWMCPLPK